MLGTVVEIIFKIIFYLKIYYNNILKFIFNINILKYLKICVSFLKIINLIGK
jgi:hypothetical protein